MGAGESHERPDSNLPGGGVPRQRTGTLRDPIPIDWSAPSPRSPAPTPAASVRPQPGTPPPPDPPPMPAAPPPTTMAVTLEVVGGPNKGTVFTCDRHETFIVGRASGARFQLPPADKTVSRNHFLIEVCPPRCIIMDLNSTNKTRVNRRAIGRRTRLKDGDTIQAGTTVFRVRIAGEAADEGGGSESWPRGPAEPAKERGRSPSSPLPQRYQFVRELQPGSMARVVLARDLDTGEQVVIKTALEHGAGREAALQYFEREVRILKSLRHPRIAGYRETYRTEGDGLALVLEYVPGEDAESLVQKEGPLDWRRAVAITCEILEGLAYAHGQGIIHRDLKPDNVIVGPGGAQLIDFGLAKAFTEATLAGLSLLGGGRAAHGFLPPELLKDSKKVTPAADLYAAGAILYYLLAGSAPLDLSPEDPDALRAVVEDPPEPLQRRRPDLPTDLCKRVHQALEKDPKQRYYSADEMSECLEHAVGGRV